MECLYGLRGFIFNIRGVAEVGVWGVYGLDFIFCYIVGLGFSDFFKRRIVIFFLLK